MTGNIEPERYWLDGVEYDEKWNDVSLYGDDPVPEPIIPTIKKIGAIIHQNRYPLTINDENGNEVYCEDSQFEGYEKKQYDSNGNLTHWEDSDGGWDKYGYDKNGNENYWEDSNGDIDDRR